MKHALIHTLYIWTVLLLLPMMGCEKQYPVTIKLQQAESVMNEHPDSALQIMESISYPERLQGKEQADYALLMTQARSRCRIIATSDSLIRLAVDYYQSGTNNARKATALLYQADVYMDMKQNTEAVIFLKQAEEVIDEAVPSTQSLIYAKLGYLNRKSGNYELAFDYYQKALHINIAHQYSEWSISNLTNILNLPLPEVQNNAPSLIELLEANLSAALPDLQAKAYNNIGVYYETIQQQERAIHYYRKAIQTSTSVPYRAYLNLAQIYDGLGQTSLSDSLYQKALESPIWATKAQIYEALSQRSIEAGNYLEAVKYMKHYQAASDSFHTYRQVQDILELQLKHDHEVLLRTKIEAENRLLRYVMVGTTLFLLTLIMVYGGYRHLKHRNASQLEKLEEQIHQICLLEEQKSQMEDMIKELNTSLKQSKVLSDEYLQLVDQWTTQDDIQALGLYLRLQRDLSLYQPENEVYILAHWLDIVSNQFVTRLRKAHPSLTHNDLNICCFYRMGYSSEKIAKAMHLEPNSILRYIYRACSRLELPQNKKNFIEYISHL